MWWWFGQWQLIRAMSWQSILIKLIKYGSLFSTVASGYLNSNGIFHALNAVHHGSGTLSGVLVSAKVTIISLFAAALTTYIDHKSSVYGKLGSEDFRDKHTWKDIYAALDREAKKHECRVDEFDGMAGWTNPALNRRLLLNSGPNGPQCKYHVTPSPWLAYQSNDPAQKSSGAKLRRYVIKAAMSQKRVIFNSEKVRLRSDINASLSEAVQLQRTDYVTSLMTDGV